MELRPLLAPVFAAVGLALPASGVVPRRAEVGCTAGATKDLVRKFVRDYSRGQVAAINLMWPRGPRFQWFSSGSPGTRLGPPAYDRSTLAAYFRSRVRVHERLRLTELRARYDPGRNIVNFSGKLVRSADDLRPGTLRDFKGAADCVSRRPMLIVWSM